MAKILDRFNKSTPGEWKVRDIENLGSFIEAPRLESDHPYDIEILGEDDTLYPTREADIEFVANAHKDVPWLVAELTETQDIQALWRDAMREALDLSADSKTKAITSDELLKIIGRTNDAVLKILEARGHNASKNLLKLSDTGNTATNMHIGQGDEANNYPA